MGTGANVSHQNDSGSVVSHVLIEYLNPTVFVIKRKRVEGRQHLQALKISHVRLASNRGPELVIRSLVE